MLPHLGIATGSAAIKTVIVATLVLSPTYIPPSDAPLISYPPQVMLDVSTDDPLWRYLRAGLNYVEASGREVPIDYIHPGGVAYGPLALTRIAVKDVIERYERFSRYTIDEILANPILYEECARAYADLLLWHYLRIRDAGLSREEVFWILQRAWLFGPGLYGSDKKTPASRVQHTARYAQLADQ